MIYRSMCGKYSIQVVAVLLAFRPGLAVAQVKADEPIKVLTVCEVLSDLEHYDGRQIAILGRFDRGGLIDGGCALVEDRCEKPVVTKGYVWKNRIDVPFVSTALQQTAEIVLDEAQLNEKLDLVRKSSDLRCTDWPVFLPSGKITRRSIKDQWAVAYGEIQFRKGLEPPTGTVGSASFQWGNGFGHLGLAPAQIWVTSAKIRFIGSTDCPK